MSVAVPNRPSDALIELQLRADLIKRRISLGKRTVWVIKEPLQGQYFYLEPDEYRLVSRLHQPKTLSDLKEQMNGLLSESALLEFLSSLARSGLLNVRLPPTSATSTDFSMIPMQWQSGNPTDHRHWWMNLLAIRLPGIRPGRWLDELAQTTRPLVSPPAIATMSCLALAAIVIVAMNVSAVWEDLESAMTRLSATSFFIRVAVAIGVSKVIHELAHALCCSWLGGRCRSIGMMLLLGVPCLYCDVSDSWLFHRRRVRMLVSAAGMIAELGIATIAVLIWRSTNPGTVHDLAIILAVVCSVSTIVFNANPLVRFDGYFLLSDWLGIPNLSQKSGETVRRLMRGRWPAESRQNRPLVLASYGLASLLYRASVVVAIALLLSSWLDTFGLGWLGIVAVVGIVLLNVWPHSHYAKIRRQTNSKSQATSRRFLLAMVALLLIATMVPFPRSIRVNGELKPADEQVIKVAVAGHWQPLLTPGEVVKEGQLIGSTIDWQLQQKELALAGQLAQTQAMISALELSPSGTANRSSRLVWLRDQFKSQTQTLEAVRQELNRSQLFAPSNGILFSPEPRQPDVATLQANHCQWSGNPLASHNRGAFMDVGTEVASVGSFDELNAELMVSEQQLASLWIGAQVEAYALQQHLSGEVTAISQSPVSIDQAQAIYRVTAQLSPTSAVSDSRSQESTWINRARVTAEVHVKPLSVSARLRNWLAIQFSW